ncbi:MAG: hypothetical protein ACOY82_18030 [Pseudomonadota bacterium]
MNPRFALTGLCVALLFALPALAPAQERDPDVARLGQRLQAIDTDPERNAYAAYERLQARQAVQDLQSAKRKQRPLILQVAKIRVEAAEIASRTEAGRAELQRLEIERSELLVEASRRDAERARAEAERLRVAAQIHAEEAARLREAVEAESRNREQAEGLLDTLASDEAEKLRLAREREAELARREAELSAGGTPPKPKPKSKPKPKPRPGP